MHVALALIAVIGVLAYVVWSRQRQKFPALPAPTSQFERDVDSGEFDELVLATSHHTPVLVDFYARWCGPCHAFAPLLAEVTRNYKGAFLLARVDYDKNPVLIKRYQVTCVPTIALFKDGQKVDGFEGAQLPHQLRYFLAKHGIKGN